MKRPESWLRFAADVGVIAGLLFVAIELRQNTEMMRSQTRANVMQSVLGLIELERHPDLVDAELKMRRGEELTPEQTYLMANMANATLRVWENTFYQHSVGLFDAPEFEADLAVWREMMQQPHYTELWRQTRHTYSAPFREVIDDFLP